MKTLEQLGISPAPWSVTPNNFGSDDVTANDSTVVVAYEPPFEEAKDSINKRLIARAPELYDMLQSLVEYIDRECIPCGETACELMAAAHNVLAKVAGESEVEE